MKSTYNYFFQLLLSAVFLLLSACVHYTSELEQEAEGDVKLNIRTELIEGTEVPYSSIRVYFKEPVHADTPEDLIFHAGEALLLPEDIDKVWVNAYRIESIIDYWGRLSEKTFYRTLAPVEINLDRGTVKEVIATLQLVEVAPIVRLKKLQGGYSTLRFDNNVDDYISSELADPYLIVALTDEDCCSLPPYNKYGLGEQLYRDQLPAVIDAKTTKEYTLDLEIPENKYITFEIWDYDFDVSEDDIMYYMSFNIYSDHFFKSERVVNAIKINRHYFTAELTYEIY